MPAPLPVDWDAVKATAINTGSLSEAAKLYGLPPVSVRMRASRGKWLVGHRATKHLAETKAQHLATVRAAHSTQRGVTVVTSDPVTPSEAIERHMAEHRDTFRSSIATALSKAAKHAAGLEPDQILDKSRKVSDIAQAGAKLHGIGQPETQVAVQVLNAW